MYLLDYLLTQIRARWAQVHHENHTGISNGINNDDGLTTLEIAIWAGGLALLAIGVLGVITAAVKSHEADIK